MIHINEYHPSKHVDVQGKFVEEKSPGLISTLHHKLSYGAHGNSVLDFLKKPSQGRPCLGHHSK